jgi:metacaspase-1
MALSILCIHGVGHGDTDATLRPSWTTAITADLHRWNPQLDVELDFLEYDDLFDHAPLNPIVVGEALARLLASGVVHGSADLVAHTRGLLDVPEEIRWTAGMIAQWASEDRLRERLRERVLDTMSDRRYDAVLAHSLGSLVSYDTFRRSPRAIADKVYVTFGSQIGNPFVRDCFAGRIEPLDRAKMWYHLYNDRDHVFSAPIRLEASNFVQINAEFDKPIDVLNHDPVYYFNHANTQARVWFDLSSTANASRALRRTAVRVAEVRRPAGGAAPDRRALLVGINDYPDPANRLEGCVNDVFLLSSVLQESGFDPKDIRVVLDHRATTANILERLHWLLDDVRDGAERLLFYSGHGAQIPTYSVRGEADHLDECLVPYDFDWTPEHAIRDKQFVEFYSQLPYGARFVAVFDCCHAGGLTRDGGPRVRGIDPPDDIRHRALCWDKALGMWRDRVLRPEGKSLLESPKKDAYVGKSGDTFRFGRGVSLRGLPDKVYDRERRGLRHRGPYLPLIMEACQEDQLSYEYRDGAASYGAFTFSLAKVLREDRGREENPSFVELTRRTGARLKALGYDQNPCLVGPRPVVRQPVPWARPMRRPTRPRTRRAARRRR